MKWNFLGLFVFENSLFIKHKPSVPSLMLCTSAQSRISKVYVEWRKE